MQGIRHTLKNIGIDEANAQKNIETGIANTTKWAHADIDSWTKDLSQFSETLSKNVVEARLKGIEEEKAAGVAAWENHKFTEQEIQDFREGRELLRKGNLDVNDWRYKALQNGASFQESKQLQKAATGWGMVGYAEAKADTAGREWQSWSKGQMLNNDTLNVVRPGMHNLPDSDPNKFFTPNQAKTLPEKRAALAALRTKYFQDTGLMNIKPIVLAQKGGAYDQMSTSSSELLSEWRKQDSKEQSLEDIGNLWKEYARNKNQKGAVETLLSGLRLETTDGETKLDNKGALDELETGIESMMDRDAFGWNDLAILAKSPSGFKDKNNNDISFKDKWPNRFNNLKEKLIEHDSENAQEVLTRFDTQGKEILADFKKEQIKRSQEGRPAMGQREINSYKKRANELGVSVPAEILNYETQQKTDDASAKIYLDDLIDRDGGLTPGDLAPYSAKIKQDYAKWVGGDSSNIATAVRSGRSKSSTGPYGLLNSKLRHTMRIDNGVLPGSESELFKRTLLNMEADYDRLVRKYMGPEFRMTAREASDKALDDVDLKLNGPGAQKQGASQVRSKPSTWVATENSIYFKRPAPQSEAEIEENKRFRNLGINTLRELNTDLKGQLEWLQTNVLPVNDNLNIDEVEIDGETLTRGKELVNKDDQRMMLPHERPFLDKVRDFRDGKTNQLPDYFHVVASEFPGLSAKDIADAQLIAAGDEKGLYEPHERKLNLMLMTNPELNNRLKNKFSPINFDQVSLINQDYVSLGNNKSLPYTASVFNDNRYTSIPALTA